MLTKAVYKNCVIIFTNASAQFVGSSKDSLCDYVTKEKQHGAEFADLLQRVDGRIIAVENCFDNEYFEEKQRERFLCGLAQIIHDNGGIAYSNTTFENVRTNVERQEEERKKRIETKREKAKMRNLVRKFLLQKYLNNLSISDLESLLPMSWPKAELIMVQSGAKQFQLVTVKDVQNYLVYYINESKPFIDNLKDMKIKKGEQREAMSHKRNRLQERQMQNSVTPIVTSFLKRQSRQQLENLIQDKRLPTFEMDNIIAKCGITSGIQLSAIKPTHIKSFIQKTFFRNPTEIQKYIDDKMSQELVEEQTKKLKRDQTIQELMESLNPKMFDAVANKSERDLQNLKSDLHKVKSCGSLRWTQFFDELIGRDIKDRSIDITEISKLYIDQNLYFLMSVLVTAIEKRRQEANAKEEQRSEELKITAFIKISEVIKNNLKSYLTGKSKDELNDLDEKIKNGGVPKDIFDKVYAHLASDERQSLRKEKIESEILKQIEEQRQVIEECLKEAGKCFPGSSLVRIKGGGISKISDVIVDDEILVFDEKGNLSYDKVYLISHANWKEEVTYVRLQTFGKELFISPCHLIPVGGIGSKVAARDVSIGDVVFTLQDGVMASDIVTSISYKVCRGAFCPLTMNGTIVVNDVAASCYTTFVPSRIAHVLLSPIRLLFSYLPLPLFDKLLPYDDVEGMPIVLLKCRSWVTTLHAWREDETS